MKVVLMILGLFLILSCGKDDNNNQGCYECTIQKWGTNQTYKQDICTNRLDTVMFMDGNGNAQQYTCAPK
jgi:hypothetical protein